MAKKKPAKRKPAKKAVTRSAKPTAKKTAKRSPGRPKPGERVVTEAILMQIAEKHLQNMGPSAIGKALGIDESTVRHHLKQTIMPRWQEDMRSKLHEDLAKVSLIEKVAWERFHNAKPGETVEHVEKALSKKGRMRIVKQATRAVTRTGEAAWIQVIQWCVDFRARIHAHYAPTRHKVDLGSELRVAGMTPDQVDQAMLKRLMQSIEDRRKYQAALGTGDN